MSEQVFLDFSLNFNLRQTKKNMPTIIYALFTFRGRQYKVNIGAKVYPTQWNKRKQIATISNGQTRLDNHNNEIVNKKIRSLLAIFDKATRNAIFLTVLFIFGGMLYRVAQGDLLSVDSSSFLIFLIMNVLCLEFGIKKATVDRLFKRNNR